MILKLGMHVKVKSTIKPKKYKGLYCNPTMTLYRDKIGEICTIDAYNSSEFIIRFPNEGSVWWWNTAMVDIIPTTILKPRTAK